MPSMIQPTTCRCDKASSLCLSVSVYYLSIYLSIYIYLPRFLTLASCVWVWVWVWVWVCVCVLLTPHPVYMQHKQIPSQHV